MYLGEIAAISSLILIYFFSIFSVVFCSKIPSSGFDFLVSIMKFIILVDKEREKRNIVYTLESKFCVDDRVSNNNIIVFKYYKRF